jgi:hypothetical protein
MNRDLIADNHLNDRIDVTSAGTDIADTRCSAAGSEFKYNFFEVRIAVFFSGHIL